MGTSQSDREFWRDMLLAGGSSTMPRWSLDPVAGWAEHEQLVPDDLVMGIRRLADELAVSPSAVLLAVHAKVLTLLTGESEVTVGYVPTGGARPVPCRLRTGAASWRELLLDIASAESRMLSHTPFPLAELGVETEPFETVVDPAGDGGGPLGEAAGGTVLRLGTTLRGGRQVLWLHYRTDVADQEYAARLAGYHLSALGLLTTDPDSPHTCRSLLSADELDLQLHRLAGPHRELPDRRVHELFEDRVRAHPDAVAAVLGERRWTYRELNARANRLARTLRARGLGREDVVAVVTERNLDWLAAVLAVFKAGGAYLPVEPHFPARRIATTLARADCRIALTEPASSAQLDQALEELPGVRRLLVEEAAAEGDDDADLGLEVTPDQLAYIYFTSGSTGEPKGAMCEHAGMTNHLLAKIHDLEIGERTVVAQTAPQCFDISLWQLVAGLLVGGRTVLVEQQVVLDVERLLDTLHDERVAVLQVVPSYLEVVLSYLEQHPRALPDLRFVSVTGEALRSGLAQRWFACRPDIRLVNAYGLTETSDDTNHEVMDRAPDGDRVPIGRPVANVRVYVVDDQLSPVPLGAPGAIVFSGVCVGRGYVNDPERTAAAFLTDPHQDGARLYQGGDFGRWLPGGTLDFLGRRDSQVKIAGFRIEIGEIENRLLRVPGVRDGAVVVIEAVDASRHLVGFYSSARPLQDTALAGQLAESLPSYMVPPTLHWRPELPLTANGKVDRKALTALAAQLAVPETANDDQRQPLTATEQRLAAAWAQVLGVAVNSVRRHDHFFDRGGTSLSAVKLVVALERAVSLRHITGHPVLADLAAVIDAGSDHSPTTTAPAPRHRIGDRDDVLVPDTRA